LNKRADMHPRSGPLLAFLFTFLVASTAHSEPEPTGTEDALDDQLADGDIDEEDHALHLGAHTGQAEGRGESWVGLAGFSRQLLSGQNDFGAMVVVGLALDRIAAGPTPRLADPTGPPPPPSPVPPSPPTPPPPRVIVTPLLARQCVAAALRASGLGSGDSRIDALVTRARASAWLPETRVRAMRLIADATRTATLATTDGTNYYDTLGTHLVLELRLTWRFDRLLYAGDEPALERTRLERQDARSRLAMRTLELLFAWQRALVDAQTAREREAERETLAASLRASEAVASLDVLTGGWFSARPDAADAADAAGAADTGGASPRSQDPRSQEE
jgi:hypothetical protein